MFCGVSLSEKMIAKRLHEKIRHEITRRVAEQECAVGERLPSICELADSFGVSVTTVGRAIEDLRSTGIVDCVPGRGIFVREKRRFILDFGFSLTRSVGRQPPVIEPQTTIVSVTREELSSFVFREFDVPIEPICCVRTLTSIATMPIVFDTLYVSQCFGDDIVDELDRKSVGDLLHDRGIPVESSRLLIQARPASDEAKAVFSIPEGFPTLQRVYQLIAQDPVVSVFGVSESPFDRLALSFP
ncbi:GntR family transcriptional regulator [Paraburkholderia sp. CNPSo 3155]|uniref:GntR family transcriptional regulator n=2 Tax=Paraburkholderia atlantica TaxID=2654982 RepID=UPI0009FEC3B6|nr:GntR family transcriptional regulator [Paraburkholderia atlantica]MPW11390.1 GntR family transcriptional regulator [Paraburkholderia atlantica]